MVAVFGRVLGSASPFVKGEAKWAHFNWKLLEYDRLFAIESEESDRDSPLAESVLATCGAARPVEVEAIDASVHRAGSLSSSFSAC